MKHKQNFSIYLFLLLGISLVLTSSCENNIDKENIDEENCTLNTFTDTRDGTVYKTVTIGNQVWMAENLKYLPSVESPSIGSKTTPYYYVYGYDGTNITDARATTNYNTYGVLYNWEAAKTSPPVGWHLPSYAEWKELTDYVGGVYSGKKLKEATSTHWNSPNNEGGTNETCFTALPAGYRYYEGSFNYINGITYWWSSTEISAGSTTSWAQYLSNSNYFDEISFTNETGCSIRCIKD